MKGYFNHFPKNFLAPYGRQKPLPADQALFDRLRVEGCEWLWRPHIAMSELSSTMSDNIEILQADDLLLSNEKVKQLTKRLEPLNDTLKKFHRDYEGQNIDGDKRDAVLGIIDPTPELRDTMLAAIEVGGALFSMGINFMVANRLFSNPHNYAQKMSFAPLPDPKFTTTKNIVDLLPLLHVPKIGMATDQREVGTGSSSVQHLVNALTSPPPTETPPSTSATNPQPSSPHIHHKRSYSPSSPATAANRTIRKMKSLNWNQKMSTKHLKLSLMTRTRKTHMKVVNLKKGTSSKILNS